MIVGNSFSCRLAGAWCDVMSLMVKWQTGSGIVCNMTIRGPHGSGGSGNASIFRGFSRVPAFFSNREGYLTLTARSRVLVCSSCQLWSQVFKHRSNSNSNLRWSLWTVHFGWDGAHFPSWNRKKNSLLRWLKEETITWLFSGKHSPRDLHVKDRINKYKPQTRQHANSLQQFRNEACSADSIIQEQKSPTPLTGSSGKQHPCCHHYLFNIVSFQHSSSSTGESME